MRWTGRPVTRVVAADVRGGLILGLGAALVLAALLVPVRGPTGVVRGAPIEQVVGIAIGSWAFVAATVTVSRPAGAGRLSTLCTAMAAPSFATFLVLDSPGWLPCAQLLLGWSSLLIRWRERLQVRYAVEGRRVTIVRPRLTVAFDLRSPPRAVPDRFGGTLGDLDFGPVDAEVTTRWGRVVKIAGLRRWFERIDEPARVAELLDTVEHPA